MHCKEISIYVFLKKELRGLSPNFQFHVSVRYLCIPTFGPAAEYADQPWKFINHTQKHESRNWDCGRAVPFLEIYVWNFGIVSLQCVLN